MKNFTLTANLIVNVEGTISANTYAEAEEIFLTELANQQHIFNQKDPAINLDIDNLNYELSEVPQPQNIEMQNSHYTSLASLYSVNTREDPPPTGYQPLNVTSNSYTRFRE